MKIVVDHGPEDLSQYGFEPDSICFPLIDEIINKNKAGFPSDDIVFGKDTVQLSMHSGLPIIKATAAISGVEVSSATPFLDEYNNVHTPLDVKYGDATVTIAPILTVCISTNAMDSEFCWPLGESQRPTSLKEIAEIAGFKDIGQYTFRPLCSNYSVFNLKSVETLNGKSYTVTVKPGHTITVTTDAKIGSYPAIKAVVYLGYRVEK